jgi:hypothetical protein
MLDGIDICDGLLIIHHWQEAAVVTRLGRARHPPVPEGLWHMEWLGSYQVEMQSET